MPLTDGDVINTSNTLCIPSDFCESVILMLPTDVRVVRLELLQVISGIGTPEALHTKLAVLGEVTTMDVGVRLNLVGTKGYEKIDITLCHHCKTF